MAQTAHTYKRMRYRFRDDAPSLTIPGQVLSINQVRERFKRGQGIQTFPGVYNPDIPPGLENLTKIERIDALRHQTAVVRNVRSTLQKNESERRAKEVEDRVNAAVAAALEKKSDDNLQDSK